MRALFLFLVAANALVYALANGIVPSAPPDGHDPGRLVEQVEPQKIRLVSVASAPPVNSTLVAAAAGISTPSLANASSTAQKPLACIEFGGFNSDDGHRLEQLLAPLNLGARMTTRHLDDQATFIVYLPPYKTKADADRAAAELKRIGVPDFFIIQDPGPFHLAISLGIFHSEEAAKGMATSLSQEGVKNAKTGERPSTISKTFYQFRPADFALLGRLNDLRTQFPNEDLHECAASAATDTGGATSSLDNVATSSSGT